MGTVFNYFEKIDKGREDFRSFADLFSIDYGTVLDSVSQWLPRDTVKGIICDLIKGFDLEYFYPECFLSEEEEDEEEEF